MYLPFRVVLYNYTNYIIYHKLPQNSCISNTTVSCAVIVAGIAQFGVLIPADTQDSSVLTVRTGLGPSQHPVQSVTRVLSPQIRRPVRKADGSPRSSAEVTNKWSCTFTARMPLWRIQGRSPVLSPLAVQHSVLPVSSHNVSSAICPSQRTIIPSAATVGHVNHADSFCPVPATVS
jgi:hypothetical protein